MEIVFVIAPCTPRCQNGGLCIARDVCKCPPEYMGERCQYPLCRPPCINNGHCVRPNVCMCPAAWKGDHCQKPVCHLPCLNGGRYRALSHCMCLDDFNVFTLRTRPHSNTRSYSVSNTPPSKYFSSSWLIIPVKCSLQQNLSQLSLVFMRGLSSFTDTHSDQKQEKSLPSLANKSSLSNNRSTLL